MADVQMAVPFEDATKYINVGGLDNLADCEILNEELIMEEIHKRYLQDNIQTYVGDILLVTNPYMRFPIYTKEIRDFYMGGQIPKGQVAPHCYKMADTAYENMCKYKKPQTFVISGESGAGKTETTKIVVSHIMHLCRAGKTTLEEKIKNLNPFLEAFGNSKTLMNNNSSRFGKYLELSFDDAGSICGASMSHYLLEKSRVTNRNDGEQSFHIFYQLYAGLKAAARLRDFLLVKPSANRYLQGVGAPTDDDVLEGRLVTMGDGLNAEWNELVEALGYIGVEGDVLESLTNILAGIVHTGDVDFQGGASDSSSITTPHVVDNVCQLLKIDRERLSAAFVSTTSVMRGERVVKHLNTEKAASNRDAMAKMIYSKIFVWIFELCNELLVDPASHSNPNLTIGVLDIFGFEIFKMNSLEQMCIDLTNEQLQGYFNHHIFVAEQQEYKAEGISLDKISFVDNQPTLDLFLAKGGLFSILDEESRFPKASDLTFTHKASGAFSSHKSGAFAKPKSDRDQNFTITHYAGEVTYTTDGFLEKNRDKLEDDVAEVLIASTDALLAKLFDPSRPSNQVASGKGKKAPTLCSIFKTSLASLMERMGRCQPHFIRCLKTNAEKKPRTWDEDLVMRQLRYAGVLETIKIRKMGFSFRMQFEDFVRSYNNIIYHYHETPPATKETCERILEALRMETGGLDENFDNTAVGLTKVFMKYYHSDILSAVAKKHSSAVSFLQKIVRGHVARQQYFPLREAARRNRARVTDLLAACESHGARISTRAEKLRREDEAQSSDRGWLERIKMQAAMAEAEHIKEEETAKLELEKVANEPTEFRTKSVNGYFIWERNEHLTLKKGALERPWRKKLDETTGRHYYKNTETKTTTWIDPRSYDFDERPHDPAACVGDQLPFGWDKAETNNGTVFYVDHINNTHHRQHPRDEVASKIAQRRKLEEDAEEETNRRLALINDLKTKRTLLTTQVADAVDTASRDAIDVRIKDLSHTIDKETAFVEKIRFRLESLDAMISNMRAKKTRDCLTQSMT